MGEKIEAYTPRHVFRELIRVAGEDILIGGQALSVWAEIYGVALPPNVMAISRDVDFLTTSPVAHDSLKRYAQVLRGKTHIFDEKRITVLVGQAYKELPNDELLNVDVLWTVYGLEPATIRSNAVQVTLADSTFWLMHPVDVLRSRMMNLHKLPAKQNDIGVMQLRLAVNVVRKYLGEKSERVSIEDRASGRSPLQPLVSEIEKLAIDDAGRKIAERYDVCVADAIDPSLIPAGPFWVKKWPGLKLLMSAEYAAQFEPLALQHSALPLAQAWHATPSEGMEHGRVVALSSTEVIQDVGRGRRVVWDRATLHNAKDLSVGDVVTIRKSGHVERSKQREGPGR